MEARVLVWMLWASHSPVALSSTLTPDMLAIKFNRTASLDTILSSLRCFLYGLVAQSSLQSLKTFECFQNIFVLKCLFVMFVMLPSCKVLAQILVISPISN